MEAYSHIAPILRRIAKALRKEPHDLEIYDPYFCAGTMKAHMRAAGFAKVYNKKEDFYQVVRAGKVYTEVDRGLGSRVGILGFTDWRSQPSG